MLTRTQTSTSLTRLLRGLACAVATVGAISVAACDDSVEQRKPGPTPALPSTPDAKAAPEPAAATPTPATPTPATPATPTPPATAPAGAPDIAGVVRTYSGCYTDCFTERASATNRETCKLTCDAAAEATIEGMKGASLDSFKAATTSFTACVNACYADKSLSSTNRATCVLTCQDAAEVAASTPPGK